MGVHHRFGDGTDTGAGGNMKPPHTGWVLLAILALVLAPCSGQHTDHNSSHPDQSTDGTAEQDQDPSPDSDPDPEPALAWGPTQADLDEATERAAQMADEDLAGQVIIARYTGNDPASAAAV